MIEWATTHLFGAWGAPALELYGAHALPINVAVLAYGLALVLLHRRVRPYRAAAMTQVREHVRRAPDRAGRELERYVASRMDWDAVAAVGPGAVVVGRWQLRPRRVTPQTLARMLPMSEMCRDARDGYDVVDGRTTTGLTAALRKPRL